MIEKQNSNYLEAVANQQIIKKSVDLICGKWRLAVINLLRKDTLRYGEIKRLIPDISEKVLVQELKNLVEVGILTKKAYSEIPPRVEYTLTEKGRRILPVIDLLIQIGPKIL
jgi:DNA-binding HxlR family transcriptional regulator